MQIFSNPLTKCSYFYFTCKSTVKMQNIFKMFKCNNTNWTYHNNQTHMIHSYPNTLISVPWMKCFNRDRGLLQYSFICHTLIRNKIKCINYKRPKTVFMIYWCCCFVGLLLQESIRAKWNWRWTKLGRPIHS